MIAQRLIEDARAAGLSMEVDGGDLIVEADCEMPPVLLASLRQHKAEVITALTPVSADEIEERAALVEYGAGVSLGLFVTRNARDGHLSGAPEAERFNQAGMDCRNAETRVQLEGQRF